jgi:hypothetical protein
VLPAWDGSKTALAGSKFGGEKLAIEALKQAFLKPIGRAPAGTTKLFPTALVRVENLHSGHAPAVGMSCDAGASSAARKRAARHCACARAMHAHTTWQGGHQQAPSNPTGVSKGTLEFNRGLKRFLNFNRGFKRVLGIQQGFEKVPKFQQGFQKGPWNSTGV